MHIVSRWRDDIKTGVSEGEDYVTYSNVLLPSVKTEAKKIAMKLVHFEKITTDMLSTAKEEKSKEEKAAEITKSIVYSTKNMQPIAITAYLSSLESEPEDASVLETQSFDGTAVKTDNNTWLVIVENQPRMTVTDKDLLDTNKFFVQGKLMSAEDKATTKKVCETEVSPQSREN